MIVAHYLLFALAGGFGAWLAGALRRRWRRRPGGPTLVAQQAIAAATKDLSWQGERGLRPTMLHGAVLADQLLARGCEIGGVRR